MNENFWRGKRVFLTGHTGFKGSWLSLGLQSMGSEVTGYALQPPTSPSLYEIGRVAEGMHSIIADIRDATTLANALQAAKADIVIHMAAQALVRQSYVDPLGTYATNVMGTAHLLDAVRQVKSVRAVVNVTSDKCYENREWVWGYRENEAMGGFDPYSSSKGCAELVTAAYRNSYFPIARYGDHGVAIATARAGNVIGGGDWAADRLIPDILRALSEGKPAIVRNPNAVRPWQHVLEPLSGYLLLAQALFEEGEKYAGAWNFGPADEDAQPVSCIADRLTALWGGGAHWITVENTGGHEANQLRLDCTKARQQLRWKPRWNLEKSLTSIVGWHRAFIQGSAMDAITHRQIQEFNSDD